MRVTIISDASVCPKQHVGGYGFWSVSNRGSHAGEGSFKGSVLGSHTAEMMAIVNAIHCSIKVGAIVSAFDELKAKHALDIEFRHVKGHSKNTGSKFTAQRLSDQRARRNMKKARNVT